MTLIEQMMEPCVILNRVRRDDPVGGYIETWEDGATFEAAVIKNTTNDAVIAEKQGMNEIFTVVVRKSFELDFHDVFRRVSDGEIFRVTSRQKDSEAPTASTVQIGKVQAERWVLPT